MIQYYSRRTYQLLGIALTRKHPEIAQELLPLCIKDDGKIEQIPSFFKRFCEFRKLNPTDYKGKLNEQEKVMLRMQYICSMVLLYHQEPFFSAHVKPPIKQGFVKQLSESIAVTKSTVSRQVRQSIFYYYTYEEFNQHVTETIVYLQSINHGST